MPDLIPSPEGEIGDRTVQADGTNGSSREGPVLERIEAQGHRAGGIDDHVMRGGKQKSDDGHQHAAATKNLVPSRELSTIHLPGRRKP